MAQSHRDYLRSGYLHHRLPVGSNKLIITVITPLPTKPSATKKMPENWKLANAAITDMQMRQRDVAALDAKYTKELADAKAENDACVMMLPLVVVGCTSPFVSQCVKLPPPPAWIMQPPPTWRTLAERDYFTSERLITMQKQLEGTQKYINEQCR